MSSKEEGERGEREEGELFDKIFLPFLEAEAGLGAVTDSLGSDLRWEGAQPGGEPTWVGQPGRRRRPRILG